MLTTHADVVCGDKGLLGVTKDIHVSCVHSEKPTPEMPTNLGYQVNSNVMPGLKSSL